MKYFDKQYWNCPFQRPKSWRSIKVQFFILQFWKYYWQIVNNLLSPFPNSCVSHNIWPLWPKLVKVDLCFSSDKLPVWEIITKVGEYADEGVILPSIELHKSRILFWGGWAKDCHLIDSYWEEHLDRRLSRRRWSKDWYCRGLLTRTPVQ